MKKLLAPLTLGGVAIIGLFACLGGDNKGEGGGLSGTIEILSHDQVNHVIVTRQIEYHCEGANVLADTTVDTTAYVIAGGKLYTWSPNGDFANDPDECYADVATGSSSTIIGTWTVVNTPEPIPTQPASCPSPLPPHSGSGGGMDDNLTMTYTVTASNVTISMSGDMCFAEQMAAEITEPGVITATSTSCNSVSLRNDASLNAVKPTATLTSSMGNGVVTLTFRSGSATCTMTQNIGLPGVRPTCPQDDGSAFNACVMGSGFFSTPVPLPMPLPKRGGF